MNTTTRTILFLLCPVSDEGHSWAGSRRVLSFAVRKAHIDLHLKYFKHAQLIISDGDYRVAEIEVEGME